MLCTKALCSRRLQTMRCCGLRKSFLPHHFCYMSRRYQSVPTSLPENGPATSTTMVHSQQAPERATMEQVWDLWNEGNLFSLSVTQMTELLNSVGVAVEPGAKKAAVVRRLEEYLHSKDTTASASSHAPETSPTSSQNSNYGRWSESALPPETLLDLAQSGFYDGAANVAPQAFQLLPKGSSADTVIARVNTTAFPGFPSNMECYTLAAAEASISLQARFSKVLQWCFLNMNNLQMDGELVFSLGKLLVHPTAIRGTDDRVLSAYVLQQRLQLNRPYTWVTAVPESVCDTVETFLSSEGFATANKYAQLSYDGTVKRAKDVLKVELNDQGKLLTLHNEWVNIQTVHHTMVKGPDVRILLRSRPPVRRQDVDTYSQMPLIELANDDVSDVLAPEHGQLVYLSENETRRFERVNDMGVVVTVTEVKRQPLIVLHDDEEDTRLEYHISVNVPASGGSARAMDVRAVGLELFDLAGRFAAAVEEPFVKEFGCNITGGE